MPLTAQDALRDSYAGGAVDDDQAMALAEMLLMVKNGSTAQDARVAVAAAFKEHFAVSGAV